jgi:hypothetical protein
MFVFWDKKKSYTTTFASSGFRAVRAHSFSNFL